MSQTYIVPVLPLRDIVVFPYMTVPLFVGRDRSIRALETVAKNSDQRILLVTQKESTEDNPAEDEIYPVGVLGHFLQLLKLPDGTVKVLVEGGPRVRIERYIQKEPFFLCEVEIIGEIESDTTQALALMRSLGDQFEQYSKLNKKIPNEVVNGILAVEETGRFADTIAAHLLIKVSEKQTLLEMLSVSQRLEELYSIITRELEVLQVEQRIRGRVKRQMEKSQRDYYLNEQMKAIQKELGERDEFKDELDELSEKLIKAKMPEEVRKKAEAEIRKLKLMSPMSAEATVVRNYLDWLLSLPWYYKTRLTHDLGRAEAILEEDHYGLDKIKERILEYLAVQQRVKKMKGPILCLVGPPGVGKTSLAKSIARASGRRYIRASLGGVRDEAEIRGHRRTYIGSLPGKIIQSMKKAGSVNPLFLLDEIDKLGSDFRGDPSSALLEVLDPEQNYMFNDHYLEVDYDLSNVMFITTSNSLNISRPLLDRMEVIRLAGYTEDEKMHIAKKYLIPRQIKAHGLRDAEISISDAALLDIIRYYTREAGVRNLEREIATLARKATRDLVQGKKQGKVMISGTSLGRYLGVKRHRYGEAEAENLVGVATGLAWTEVGGELLSIEASVVVGKGKLTMTGKLGDVMQESAQAALTYARSRAPGWGLSADFFQEKDIHVHVPEGAIPKDGPSAGIAIGVSLISCLTKIPIKKELAMTGEITLRGRVLPIGGLKEKLLAAQRARIQKVIIPQENVKDLKEVPQSILKELEILPVSLMDEVLGYALDHLPEEVGVGVTDGAGAASPVPSMMPPLADVGKPAVAH